MGIIHNNEKGFTLVELLVSMLIFAIGVAALTQTLIATIKGNSLGNKETAAITLAYHEIEELRGIDPNRYDDPAETRLNPQNVVKHGPTLSTGLVATANQNVIPNLFGGYTAVNAPNGRGGGYHVSYIVTSASGPSQPLFYSGAKRVDVTVTWYDSASRSVTLSSILTPNI